MNGPMGEYAAFATTRPTSYPPAASQAALSPSTVDRSAATVTVGVARLEATVDRASARRATRITPRPRADSSAANAAPRPCEAPATRAHLPYLARNASTLMSAP